MAGPWYLQIDGFGRQADCTAVFFQKSLKQRATAEFSTRDLTLGYMLNIGARVEIGDADKAWFGGTIDEVRREWAPHVNIAFYRVRCVSYEQICSRRRTGKRHYDRQPGGYIVRDLIANCLTGEGVSDIDVLDGPDVGPIDFDHATVEEAIDTVCAEAGYFWDITAALTLRYFGRTHYAAPWDIDPSQSYVLMGGNRFISATFDRQKLANRVWVRAGQYIGEPLTESFTGDGNTREWALTQECAAAPTVTLNGSERTVGIGGVETGFQFYWNVGSKNIRHDDGESVLEASDTVEVTYTPQRAETILAAEDLASQAERQTVEGLSGIYETVVESSTPTTRQDAVRIGEAVLVASKPTTWLQLDTLRDDLEPGQVQRINFPSMGIDDYFLIETLSMNWTPGSLRKFTAECSTGGVLPTWQQVLGGGGGGGGIAAVTPITSAGAAEPQNYLQEVLLDEMTEPIQPIAKGKSGKLLVVRVRQGSSAVLEPAWGGRFVGASTSVSDALGSWTMYLFAGRDDDTWWQVSNPVEVATV